MLCVVKNFSVFQRRSHLLISSQSIQSTCSLINSHTSFSTFTECKSSPYTYNSFDRTINRKYNSNSKSYNSTINYNNNEEDSNDAVNFDPNNTKLVFSRKTTQKLLFEAVLYKLCSYDLLINLLIRVINTNYINVPVKFIIKKFVYTHFCGGETLSSCKKQVFDFANSYSVKSIVDHSTEEFAEEHLFDKNLLKKVELIQAISSQFNFENNNKPVRFIPLKVTSLVSSSVLEEITLLSSQQGNSSQQKDSSNTVGRSHEDIRKVLDNFVSENVLFQRGLKRLEAICESAKVNGITILLDAEQTNRQPAINLLFRRLALSFNRISSADHTSNGRSVTICNTYQAYLKCGFEYFKEDLDFCRKNDIIFAAKVVRGAYVSSETTNSKKFGYDSPLQPSKEATDANYNRIVDFAIRYNCNPQGKNDILLMNKKLPLFLVVASHNKDSISSAVQLMSQLGISKNNEFIHFAQIMGMSDNVTIALGQSGYNSYKLIPFGDFEEVLPWLVRRLEENQVNLSLL